MSSAQAAGHDGQASQEVVQGAGVRMDWESSHCLLVVLMTVHLLQRPVFNQRAAWA